ncbi:hypothetical protein C8R46DRAFT_1050103 [Mycena filopes]|nr:hypothetical protein C8R46DRAFT_1050103 [Mycena filopes]
MPDISSLTPAEKRKITIAAKAEKERQEQVAFELEKKRNPGGRQAKRDAKAAHVWTVDLPASTTSTRKRTSSTAQASEKPKRAREEKDAGESEPEEDQAPVKSKAAKSKARAHAPPPIVLDSDEEEEKNTKSKAQKKKTVRIDFTDPTTFPSATTAKPLKAAAPSVASGKKSHPTKAPKLVAESASESDDASDHDSDTSGGAADVAPNADEFLAEVPRVVGKKTKAISEDDAEDVEMQDSSVSTTRVKDEKVLFLRNILTQSDYVNYGAKYPRQDYIRQALNRAAAVKAAKGNLTDEDMPGLMSSGPEDNDEDFHEAMAKAVTGIPRHRRGSSASWSSGQDISVPETDIDDVEVDVTEYPSDDDSENEPVVQQKVRKVSAARQKKAELERPQVRPAAPAVNTKKLSLGQRLAEAASRPETDWDASAQIVYPEPGKDIRLNDQGDHAKRVIRGGIQNLKTSLLFEDAYPQIISRSGFSKAYFSTAADNLGEVHIKERLVKDPKYGRVLSDLLIDRVNILRGGIKKIAVNVAPGHYQLSTLTAGRTKDQVEELIKDHRYIFPFDPSTNLKRLKFDLPFHHPAIIAILKQGVFTGQFKTNVAHLFVSTNKKRPNDVELPDAMVALAATAVYAALAEYRLTGERQSINFTEGAYEDTYRNHMKTLADTRVNAPVALHKVLHGLYKEVSDVKSVQAASGSSATLINLVDVPEADN